jgi:5'-nucleotidase
VTNVAQLLPVLSRLLAHITSLPNLPRDTLFNVNLPPIPAEQVRGIRLTRLGRRVYSNSLQRMKDPWGREIFWIGGGSIAWSGHENSDFRAIEEGFVSVTPLHLDLTHFDLLDTAASWWQDP